MYYRHEITNNDNATRRKNHETCRNSNSNKLIPRCNRKRSEISGKRSGKHRILKKQTEDVNSDN